MKEFSFLLLLMCLWNINIYGQGRIEFSETIHDFGKIKESDGPVSYQFEFNNVGDKPLVIKNIKASCGCTSPEWTKDTIAVGEKGFFQAKYNPQNRPGAFKKTLTINANGKPEVVKVYITGTVEPRGKAINEKMPVKLGAVRLKSRTINLGRSVNKGVLEAEFEMYNDGIDTLMILDKVDAAEFISLLFEDSLLAPGASIRAKLRYDTDHYDNLGLQNHGVSFYTNEINYAQKNINVMLTLKDYFPEMNEEELGKAPKLFLRERQKNIGTIYQGASQEITFTIENHGKEKLEIKKIESNCSCLISTVSDETIKSGKSAKITVLFRVDQRIGRQNKSIFIYSNDPVNPTQVVTIRASVAQKN